MLDTSRTVDCGGLAKLPATNLTEVMLSILENMGSKNSCVLGNDPTQVTTHELDFALNYGFGGILVDENSHLSPPDPETVHVKVVSSWYHEVSITSDNVNINFCFQPKSKQEGAKIHRPVVSKYENHIPELWSNDSPQTLIEVIEYVLETLIFAGKWGREVESE